MGLFDKIKDNAKNISIRALDEANNDYEESIRPTYLQQTPEPLAEAATINAPSPIETETKAVEPDIAEIKESDSSNAEASDDTTNETPEDKEEKEKPASNRKSKVTEISKQDHEKAEKEKRQNKAKQAAKERLAKSYVPSYKATKPGAKSKEDNVSTAKEATKAVAKKLTVRPRKNIGIIDVTPNKLQAPAVGAGYARERAALTVLASQRKLNGTVPLYSANHMNFRVKVFIDRIEYSGSFGKNVIPIEQVAWVKLRHGGTGIIVETVNNKRVVMVVKQSDRLGFTDAVLKVQALQPKKNKFKDTKTIRIDELERFSEGVDEIEKLAKLYDKGILSQQEFDAKKKQILGL